MNQSSCYVENAELCNLFFCNIPGNARANYLSLIHIYPDATVTAIGAEKDALNYITNFYPPVAEKQREQAAFCDEKMCIRDRYISPNRTAKR